MKRYQQLFVSLQARENCKKSGNDTWQDKHTETIDKLINDLPSGGGFDSGSQLKDFSSKPEKIVFSTSFHHMNDDGYYIGWSDHDIIVTPSFTGFDIRVTGRNVRDIKEYIGDVFYECLNKDNE